MRASYWTAFGAMAFPLGVSLIALATVFDVWQDFLIVVGLVSVVIGFFCFVAGWVYTVREERKADEKEKEEREQRKRDDLRNQQEHDEIMAMLAGTLRGGKVSSPRMLSFIRRLREMESKKDDNDM